jgi:hypothetical protein
MRPEWRQRPLYRQSAQQSAKESVQRGFRCRQRPRSCKSRSARPRIVTPAWGAASIPWSEAAATDRSHAVCRAEIANSGSALKRRRRYDVFGDAIFLDRRSRGSSAVAGDSAIALWRSIAKNAPDRDFHSAWQRARAPGQCNRFKAAFALSRPRFAAWA